MPMVEEQFIKILKEGEENAEQYGKEIFFLCDDTECVEKTNDGYKKCSICWGYYEDNSSNDIFFPGFWDQVENSCIICHMSTDKLIQLKSTGEYMCKGGCDDGEESSVEEEDGGESSVEEEEDGGESSVEEEDGGESFVEEEDGGESSVEEEDGGESSVEEEEDGGESYVEEEEDGGFEEEEDGGISPAEYTNTLVQYLTNENNHYDYTLKKCVYDWYVMKKCSDSNFWRNMSENNASGFLFNNLYHIQQLLCSSFYGEFEKYEGHGEVIELFINVLECEYPRKHIDWFLVASNDNPKAVKLIEENIHKLTNPSEWDCLSSNKNAIHIIEKNMDKVEEHNTWDSLCKNPAALEILSHHRDKCNNRSLCENPNPEILKLIDIDMLGDDEWMELFSNPSARFIFENHMDKLTQPISHALFVNSNVIDLIEKMLEGKKIEHLQLQSLCSNKNAAHLINKHLHMLKESDLYNLNTNPGAIDILEQNPHLIRGFILENPAIFEKK